MSGVPSDHPHLNTLAAPADVRPTTRPVGDITGRFFWPNCNIGTISTRNN